MNSANHDRPRRVAISLEIDWAYKRHLEVYAGCQRYADEVGWHCTINPAVDRLLQRQAGEIPYDGVIARATKPLAEAVKLAGIPLVNVWLNTPVKALPSVFSDWKAAGVMAAEHLLARGFRQFGFLGFEREIDSRLQLEGFREPIRRKGFRCTACRFPRTAVAEKARGWERFVGNLEDWVGHWQTPIGVFVCQDLVCRYLLDMCRSKGLHVSQDVAVVGCCNETEICRAPSPSLTMSMYDTQ